jgi:hypothetical protein
MKRVLFLVLSLSLAVSCGKAANNGDGSNNGNNGSNSSSADDECQTNDDCPAASDATFLRPDEAVCADSSFRGKYCTECANDQQCEKGEACRDATYCVELPPCETGDDCSDNPGEVHQACISKVCDFCIDDADCESDEVCYSRLCATRTEVDPTCIEASCEGTCEIQYDDDGAATGVSCL